MSINPTKKDDDKPASRQEAESETGVADAEDLLGRSREALSASVVDFVEPEQSTTQTDEAAIDEGTPGAEERPLAALLRPNVLPVIGGALSGALAAIMAVFVLTELRPPMDPRLEPMAEHLGTFTQRMRDQENGLRAVEVDLVRTLAQQTEVKAAVVKQNAQIATALGQVKAVSDQIRAENGPGSSVFGVAVVQLADSIDAGRPFEAEWVNLFSLTVGEPELRAGLQRLLPFSRSGVYTIAELRHELRADAEQAGLTIAKPENFFWIAADYLQKQLGLPLGVSPAAQAAEAALTESDRRLAKGDIGGAVKLVADLGTPFAEGFGAWTEAARRRALANVVATRLTEVARREISLRARRRAAVQNGQAPDRERRALPLSATR
ncbi:MAG: hypothetical protein HN377_00115 [Alphaproteobacteria bacterium]|jgi:hypothetical protein|nr:hypothetical protein [Alphaproteobacteria bacterium]MBT4566069.1 hypothetical protein [Rhodospirillaceae bacterium]MBT7157342.1 hypothetical protein [Rhodospirillaceae bacterium]